MNTLARRMSLLLLAFLLCEGGGGHWACAQTDVSNRNQPLFTLFKLDWEQEQKNLGACKSFKGIPGCAETLFTGTPFHIVVGSLAPQNGIAFGLGAAEFWHPTFCAAWIDHTKAPPPGQRNACHWSVIFNADGEASTNGSFRAGFYADATHIAAHKVIVHIPGQPEVKPCKRDQGAPYPVVSFYSETDSLNRIYFFGLGPNTTPAARTDFGFTENITGLRGIVPVHPCWLPIGLKPVLLAEINARIPSVRGSYGDTSPSIETIYTDATAPGLASQPGTLQTGEGIRFLPQLFTGRLKFNYMVNFQQFTAPSNSRDSFRRYTADLNQTFQITRKDSSGTEKPAPATVAKPAPIGKPAAPVSVTRDVFGTSRLGC